MRIICTIFALFLSSTEIPWRCDAWLIIYTMMFRPSKMLCLKDRGKTQKCFIILFNYPLKVILTYYYFLVIQTLPTHLVDEYVNVLTQPPNFEINYHQDENETLQYSSTSSLSANESTYGDPSFRSKSTKVLIGY
jgi:hypothetical protein